MHKLKVLSWANLNDYMVFCGVNATVRPVELLKSDLQNGEFWVGFHLIPDFSYFPSK